MLRIILLVNNIRVRNFRRFGWNENFLTTKNSRITVCIIMFIATVHSCRLLREKLNSSQIALESMILYKRNKTADWLKTKSDEEKKKMLYQSWLEPEDDLQAN